MANMLHIDGNYYCHPSPSTQSEAIDVDIDEILDMDTDEIRRSHLIVSNC